MVVLSVRRIELRLECSLQATLSKFTTVILPPQLVHLDTLGQTAKAGSSVRVVEGYCSMLGWPQNDKVSSNAQ